MENWIKLNIIVLAIFTITIASTMIN